MATPQSGPPPPIPTPPDLESFRQRVHTIASRVDELEGRVKAVKEFFERKGGILKEKGKKTKKGGGDRRVEIEAAAAKRLQGLTGRFRTILRQLSNQKYAHIFMQPVDVEGLGLHDYYEIIKKPMDLGTIRSKMEATDGTGYKNVREIYVDVRLVFENAMKYNAETHTVHIVAKSMLDMLEKKWQQLLPKIVEDETQQKEEAKLVAQTDNLIEQEVATAKLAKDSNQELKELATCLEELRETVVRNYRKMSTEEKRKIANGFCKLPPEDIQKGLQIIAHKSKLLGTPQGLHIDIDTQNESTLWRLKFFIDSTLELQAKRKSDWTRAGKTKRTINTSDGISVDKRKIDDDDAPKTTKKRSKKAPS